jgi:hypothetical protein
MSVRRLITTAALVAGMAAVLAAVAPTPAAAWSALSSAQTVVDTAGVDALLLPLAGALTWLAWGWGALGLLTTGAAVLPGALGATARGIQRLLLPAAGRRAAAVLIGVGIGLGGGAGSGPAAAAPADPGPPATATDGPGLDWPSTDVPDWPPAASTGTHVVAPGDCLWTIAAGRMARPGSPAARDAEIAGAVGAWWNRNAAVIGPDPDLLLPGQLLSPP